MVELRRAEPRDLPLLFLVYKDSAYKEFFRRVPKNWRESDVARFEESLNCHLYTYCIAGEPIGFAVVSDLDSYGSSVHTGFLVLKQFQDVIYPPTGKKYAFECINLLLNHLFLHTHLHKASMRFLSSREDIKKSLTVGGFHIEAEFKDAVFFDGRWQDETEMAILRPKYEELYLCHSY